MRRKSIALLLLTFAGACTENPTRETTTTATTTAATQTQASATRAETASDDGAPAATSSAPVATTGSEKMVAGPKLLPVDEAKSDPSFAAYREKLLSAVRRGDVEAVVALSDPKIRTSFGADGGADALRRALSRKEVLSDLEQLLQLGGAFRGEGRDRMFWAPYVYSNWPDAHDAFESLAVIAEDVPLLESSKPGAPLIGRLDFEIVRRADAKGVNVQTLDGRKGFVDPKYLRSPVGYRAGFRKESGEWRMNALVAGD